MARDNQIVVVPGGAGLAARIGIGATLPPALRRLDVVDTAVGAIVGYRFDQVLRNQLPGRAVATILTQMVVDPDDPEISTPTRFLGPAMSEAAIAGIALPVRSVGHRHEVTHEPAGPMAALSILDERFARGEIDAAIRGCPPARPPARSPVAPEVSRSGPTFAPQRSPAGTVGR